MRLTAKIALLCALLALAGTAQAELIGHWTFDEASSGTGTTGIALDSSGNNYDGTIMNGAVYTAGRVGAGALTFNGVVGGNQRVAVPYNSALALAGTSYTVAWWQKRESVAIPSQGVIGTGTDIETQGWGAYTFTRWDYPDGSILSVHGSGATNSALKYDSSLAVTDPPSWVHVALVYDKGAATRTLYVNGAASGAAIATTADVVDSALGLEIGYHANPFKGAMDDVQIYNQDLTAGEVGTVMGGGTIPEPSTLVLLGMGLLSLLAYAWRKQR